MKLWDAIMIGTVVAGTLLLATADVSFGEGGGPVPLPDISALSEDEADSLARDLARVDVITSNCAGYAVTDDEWRLLSGTGDLLAARLGLDPATYQRDYVGPAFDLLDDPSACDRIGPQARPLLNRLEEMGGATGPAAD